MKTLEQRLGEQIKKARWQKMIKQKDLAKKLNVMPSHLCEIEKGKKGPSLELLDSIEKHLGPVWSLK